MMSSRTNEGIVPTLEEIQAYKERPPILATIELVNGALLTEDLPVAPDLNVKKVRGSCLSAGHVCVHVVCSTGVGLGCVFGLFQSMAF